MPIEPPVEATVTVEPVAKGGGRWRRRTLASAGLAGLALRGAGDERVRAQVSDLVDQLADLRGRLTDLRGRGERLRRQRRRRRIAAGLLASAGATAGAVAAWRARADGPVVESVEVGVPVSMAYNQWTQFEEFPRFMEGVREVRQLDDTHLHWVASIGGQAREWDAEISEQCPDERIAWRATTGKQNAGMVSFFDLGGDRAKVEVRMSFEPGGVRERLGHAIGLDRRRVRGDLDRFKDLIEGRPSETGTWRGEVKSGERVE